MPWKRETLLTEHLIYTTISMEGEQMKRKIYKDLVDWKDRGMKKALMVIGARQVGKTYIIEEIL